MSGTNETFISGFFNSVDDDRKYNAVHWANYFGALVSDGVFPNPSTNMQVLEHIGMKVKISKGMAWIKAYFAHNMADYVLAIEPADGTLKRIDRIVLRLDLNSRLIKPEVLKGRFAASPVAPSLVRNDEVHDIALADIYVTNGTTSINQGMITDQRLNKDLCGLVHALINQVDTTTIFNQYQSWFNDYSVTKAAEFLAWQTSVTTALEAWIEAQQTDFVAWRKAEEQLYYTWLDARKNGFDSWFATIKDILDTNAAGNLQNQIDAHKDASRPHKYLDTSDNQVYEYGLQRNPILNAAAFVYAKQGEQQANVINLPTYEQVSGIEKTSGAVMGNDGGRYLANFDTGFETKALVDNNNFNDNLVRTWKEKIDMNWDVSLDTIYFLDTDGTWLLSYGVKSVEGVNKFYYAVINRDTMEVINGKIFKEEPGTAQVTNPISGSDFTVFKGRIWIRVVMAAKTMLVIINLTDGSFVKLFQIRDGTVTGTLTGNLSITDNGILGYMMSGQSPPSIVINELSLDSNNLPVGGIPKEYTYGVAYGATQGQSGAGLIAYKNDFIISTTPSGGNILTIRYRWNTSSKILEEIARLNLSGAPNPVPPAVIQYFDTLEDGTEILVRYFGTTATNGSYKTVMNLDTFTSLYASKFTRFNGRPMHSIRNRQVVYGGDYPETSMQIGSSYYVPFHVDTLDRKNGLISSRVDYLLANPPSSIGGNPSTQGYPDNTGVLNDKGIFITRGSNRRFWGLERTYNLINYTKEV